MVGQAPQNGCHQCLCLSVSSSCLLLLLGHLPSPGASDRLLTAISPDSNNRQDFVSALSEWSLYFIVLGLLKISITDLPKARYSEGSSFWYVLGYRAHCGAQTPYSPGEPPAVVTVLPFLLGSPKPRVEVLARLQLHLSCPSPLWLLLYTFSAEDLFW